MLSFNFWSLTKLPNKASWTWIVVHALRSFFDCFNYAFSCLISKFFYMISIPTFFLPSYFFLVLSFRMSTAWRTSLRATFSSCGIFSTTSSTHFSKCSYALFTILIPTSALLLRHIASSLALFYSPCHMNTLDKNIAVRSSPVFSSNCWHSGRNKSDCGYL